jgi:hypothetical protein
MNPWFVLPALVAVAAVFVLLPVGLAVYSRLRGPHAVVCPVNCRPATVRVDAGRAGWSALFGRTSLRLLACSLLPERLSCGRSCLRSLG